MKGTVRFGASGDPAWVPDPEQLKRSRLLAAMRRWGYDSIEELHARSVDDPEWFWREAVEDLDIAFTKPFTSVIDDSEGKPFPRWFVDGHINAAHLCSHRHAVSPLADKPAVIYEGEDRSPRSVTFAELDHEVRRFAANLSELGVRRGDRVVLFLPCVPEAVVVFLGCAMLGAVSVPAFTGYGVEALASRIISSSAKVLVTANATTRRGNLVPLKEVADEAAVSSDSLEKVIVLRHLDMDPPMEPGRDVYWHELNQDPIPVETAATESNDPLCILYTSGTTGKPKGIVHSHAGYTVKVGLDFGYGYNVDSTDVLAWITDMGWMLGTLLVLGGLQFGATLVLVEGVPDYPTQDRLWQIASRHKVTVQGLAPTAARALRAAGCTDFGDLSSLRAFATTGEVCDDQTWRWIFEVIGEKRRPIINYTGGTEIGGGILISYPFLPADPGSFNGPLLGMDAAVVDESGRPVTETDGELAVFNTWPGMTHAFWGDRERYLETYWSQWEGVWRHGDLARVDEKGSWKLLGRSDDTIKVSGRRVGPAELETALLKDQRIAEVAVVGVPDELRGQRVVAFIVLRDEHVADRASVASEALRNVGRSFAPAVHIVKSLPKTKNGKIMRRAIRAQHLDEPPGDMSSLDPATPLENIPKLTEAEAL